MPEAVQAKVKKSKPKLIRLKDYRPPDFSLPEIELHFDLREEFTEVRSKLTVRPGKGTRNPLLLNGERLELTSLKLNGRVLSPQEFKVSETRLEIFKVPSEEFTLEAGTRIKPQENKALEGLYKSGDIFCTQNESQGFRKITYFLDRPDVMSRFATTITADKTKYPVLLSNGNEVERRGLADGRHLVKWRDPFPKPCYLFALVAGDLAKVEDHFVTKSGRKVVLRIYVEKGNGPRAAYAMDCVKRAMKWDEDTFGLEYDLDLYMIVAVHDFNFGAMENKGLNIFNSQNVLADPETATDQNYLHILDVIGHEYFHNWTGNRVTVRDWFQITLKEGLTIFRNQEFSADMTSRPLRRIEEVRLLKEAQFVEDAGPNAHPIRPGSYLEVRNFYTATVYQKGSEVIRMIKTLIGKENFKKGMKKYFELYDGKAVTTEDFVRAMELASGMDLTQFKLWYSQAGTPVLKVRRRYEAKKKRLELTVEQKPPLLGSNPKKRGQTPAKVRPFHFPLTVALLDKKGKELYLEKDEIASAALRPRNDERERVKTFNVIASLPAEGRRAKQSQKEIVLSISKPKQTFVFERILGYPTPSLLRNFSAPVKLEPDLTDRELLFLLAHDTDPVNRYEAGGAVLKRCLLNLMKEIREKGTGNRFGLMPVPFSLLQAFGAFLRNEKLDPAFCAEALIPPSEASLNEDRKVCDFEAAFLARRFWMKALARKYQKDFLKIYRRFQGKAYSTDPKAMGERSFKNAALRYLMMIEQNVGARCAVPLHLDLAFRQFQAADNMTDRIAALALLCDTESREREEALKDFYERWRHDPLVMNKWFAVQAGSIRADTLERVRQLEKDPAFDLKNPNNQRALFGVFASNLIHFHEASGAGYEYLAGKILEIDAFNPSMAAKLSSGFKKYANLDVRRKSAMGKQLRRILASPRLSPDTYEIVSKTYR